MKRLSLFAVTPLLLSPAAFCQAPVPPQVCPVRLELDAHNHLYENRFHGRYRVSRTLLARDLHYGCKLGLVSSVTIDAAPQVRYGRVVELMDFVKQNAPANVNVAIVDHSRH